MQVIPSYPHPRGYLAFRPNYIRIKCGYGYPHTWAKVACSLDADIIWPKREIFYIPAGVHAGDAILPASMRIWNLYSKAKANQIGIKKWPKGSLRRDDHKTTQPKLENWAFQFWLANALLCAQFERNLIYVSAKLELP